jgi:hypothetical protein
MADESKSATLHGAGRWAAIIAGLSAIAFLATVVVAFYVGHDGKIYFRHARDPQRHPTLRSR